MRFRALARGMFRAPARGMFRAPARDTFGRGPKSVQKGRLNLRFKNPRTLFRLRICGLLPRVHGTWSLSCCMTYRLSFLRRCRSCASTAGNGSLSGGVMRASPRAIDAGISSPFRSAAAAQEQRRFDDGTEKREFPRTCGRQLQFCTAHSAQGSEETIGFFRLFWLLF